MSTKVCACVCLCALCGRAAAGTPIPPSLGSPQPEPHAFPSLSPFLSQTNGVKPEHGLASTGQAQAAAAGMEWARQIGPHPDPASLRIVASPFARTLETATLAGVAVGIAPGDGAGRFATAEELVERHFGGFELQDHAHYATVWEEDARDLDWHPPGGGESVRDVAVRAAALFARLEAELGPVAAGSGEGPKRVLLVAHGDTLSIATAVAKGADLAQHRAHAQETGELRRLVV